MMFVPTQNTLDGRGADARPIPRSPTWNFVRAATDRTCRGRAACRSTRPPWSVITATDMNTGEHRLVAVDRRAPDRDTQSPRRSED